MQNRVQLEETKIENLQVDENQCGSLRVASLQFQVEANLEWNKFSENWEVRQ